MHLKTALVLLFLIRVNSLFAQQIEIMPYIGVNNNITNLVMQMNSTSLAEPVTYNVMGAGLVASSASLCGGFNTGIHFKNNFGLQSGARISKTDYFFYFQEHRLLEFNNNLIYYLKSNRLAVPLHLAYDHEIPAGNGSTEKAPKAIRFFGGPVISYNFNPEARFLKSQAVASGTGRMVSSYSDVVTQPEWLGGIEAGINVNSIFKDLVSIGVLFQYNLTPAAKVNFESRTVYQSTSAVVAIQNTGSFKVIGSSLMLQVGVKPFILKKG